MENDAIFFNFVVKFSTVLGHEQDRFAKTAISLDHSLNLNTERVSHIYSD